MSPKLEHAATHATSQVPAIIKAWDGKTSSSVNTDLGITVNQWGKEVGWSQQGQGSLVLQTFDSGWAWSGLDRWFDDTYQNHEPLSQVQTTPSLCLVPFGAVVIPEAGLPAYHAPTSQSVEHSSPTSTDLMPLVAKEVTQAKGLMFIVSPGTKLKLCPALPNNGKDHFPLQQAPDSNLYNSKPTNGQVCWHNPTAVTTGPSLRWPPPCLMKFGQWPRILQRQLAIELAIMGTNHKFDVAPVATWSEVIRLVWVLWQSCLC